MITGMEGRLDVRVRRVARWAIDIAVLTAAIAFAYLLRFDGVPPPAYRSQFTIVAPSIVAVKVLALQLTRAAQRSWRYVTLHDAVSIAVAMAGAAAVLATVRTVAGLETQLVWAAVWRVPFGVLAIDLLLATTGLIGIRAARRLTAERSEARGRLATRDRAPGRTLLLGAGQAGGLVVRELRRRPDLGIEPVGFLDDDPDKRGRLIHGVQVFGRIDQLPQVARYTEADQVIITIASASGATIRRITGICEEVGLPTKIIPGIYEIVDGTVNLSRIRPVNIEDLLGREAVELDTSQISEVVRDQVVLVTGAGGSIGAELCRQIVRFEPRRLVLVERAETNLWSIHAELDAVGSEVDLVPCLLDVRDEQRVRQIFTSHRPSLVFHAAAHKHVPIAERNPGVVVVNNLFGTRTVADVAAGHGVDRFVLVSTDKAVNPVSVMGASKRLAERYVQDLAHRTGGRFMSVRFGNVLGSAGSVVPIFQQQIERGGPVTITHREMRRYFMTIPEAAQLVLQTATMGAEGEVFTLEMGEPVRILDLAHDLIRLSGLRVGDDIEIREVGPRRGEKLTEEILLPGEDTDPTAHPKILISRTPDPVWQDRDADLDRLWRAARTADETAIRLTLEELLSDYHPSRAVLPDTSRSPLPDRTSPS